MVQVGQSQLPGYGGVTAPKPGYQDSPYENWPGPGPRPPGGLSEGGRPPAGPGPFDPRGAIQIPNNFWGFVILMMGLKS